jgi:hypothetical protein
MLDSAPKMNDVDALHAVVPLSRSFAQWLGGSEIELLVSLV